MITRRGYPNGNCLPNDEKGSLPNSKGTTDIHEPSKRAGTTLLHQNKQRTSQPVRPIIRHFRRANSEIEMFRRYEHQLIRIAI